MKSSLHLAWRYVRHHRGRSLLLMLCITLTALLPLAVNLLIDRYTEGLGARARSTPLLAGARGSRYDLVLNTLYFTGRVPRETTQATAEALAEKGRAAIVPVLARHLAGEQPLVGTTLDYFERRQLQLDSGRWPVMWGEAVLGSEAAEKTGLGKGDAIFTEHGSLYDMGLRYPLKLRVVGTLAETGGPDDRGVFTDIHTVWILEGHGHGHKDPDEVDPSIIIKDDGLNKVMGPKTVEYNEITRENIASFHFHKPVADLPVTALLVYPRDTKAETLLLARFERDEQLQLLEPTVVVDELLGFVLTMKRFFDMNTAFVSIATLLFIVLVVWLSIQIRKPELETLAQIGVGKSAVAQVLMLELLMLLAGAALLALGGALLLLDVLTRMLPAA